MTTPRDSSWFEDLYRSQHGLVLAYARRRVDDADDVVSEVFAAAWRARDTVPDPPVGWLIRTAANHILHARRAAGRRTRLAVRAADVEGVIPDHADAVVARHDGSSPVLQAMAALSASDQELLRLVAWEQLEHVEIAEVLGCSQAALRVRLFRARRRLESAYARTPDTSRRAPSPTPLERHP